MARRTINRMEKRAEHEAYEAIQGKKQEDEDDDLEEDEEEDDDEENEDEASDEAERDADDEEEAPTKPRKAAKEPKPRSRTRTAKVPRIRVVWGVFNNQYQSVATYEYPKRKEAEEHAARLREEKKQTFFVQPLKEPIVEKKEG